MKRLSLLLVVLVAAVLGGCESGPQIVIETADCAECQEGDFQAGMICMDSNVAGCPFNVVNRLQTITWKGKTFDCHLLEADGYLVTFEEVEDYESPGSMDLELKEGRRIVVQGLYKPD